MTIKSKRSRRAFLKESSLAAGGVAAAAYVNRGRKESRTFGFPYLKNPKIARKVLILGMDGVDPDLVRRFVAEGELPAFKKLIESGKFGDLQSTMPPQSPVAWSSFITGCNPGGTGIYDFIHRDPATFTPYLSTSRSFDAESTFKLGDWVVPLKSGRVELMRKGPAFWSVLEANDIFSSVLQIPANFPVVEDSEMVRSLSGMGTPDLLGTYGTFTLFSDVEVPGSDEFTGGRVERVQLFNHSVHTKLSGPKNSFHATKQDTKVDLVIHRDPVERVVKINIEGRDIILKQGEWSEWIPISYKLIPMFASVGGMVRFFAKEVHPNFKLYCSPIDVDPMEPSLPICSPSGYSRELSQAVGRFYTQGFPADWKGLSHGVLSDEEYLTQAHLALDEIMALYEFELARFTEGVYFQYFSSTDQNGHMLWRTMDPQHPQYDPNASQRVKDGLKSFYKRMDYALSRAMDKVDSYTTLFVVSDHGFAPFYREFNLSTWLVEQGYTVLTDPSKLGKGDFYTYVDWNKTTAYALGLNGIYLNLQGREKKGSLNDPKRCEEIRREIITKLPGVVDPENGKSIITRAYDPRDIYSGPYVSLAPDILVGYQRGYRISDESVLGKFPRELVKTRTDKWAADHCLDPAVVPGVILSNKPWSAERPALWDMAPTILGEFGITAPKEMDGKSIYSA